MFSTPVHLETNMRGSEDENLKWALFVLRWKQFMNESQIKKALRIIKFTNPICKKLVDIIDICLIPLLANVVYGCLLTKRRL